MLRSLKDLERYTITATDGDVGLVVNFLFDDQHWTVRHLVADTGGYFGGHQVLISPISFRNADWANQRLHVGLTREMIKRSPGVNTDKPFSRQHESEYYSYYGYPYYWGYSNIWGMSDDASLLAGGPALASPVGNSNHAPFDVHLRSVNEVRGYHIRGSDGALGHVHDFIVDDRTWQIRYLIIDTSNWWLGKKVLLAPSWATSVSWVNQAVDIQMSRDAIKRCPEWDPTEGVNHEYEMRLYDYYGRPAYWTAPTPPSTHPL